MPSEGISFRQLAFLAAWRYWKRRWWKGWKRAVTDTIMRKENPSRAS